MMKKLLTTLVIAFSIPAFAVEYQSPRTLALGGAGRAGPLLNDSIYLNPSYASFTPIYSVSGGYTWFDQGRNYNISVQDARTQLFQAGVAFTRREQNSAINLGASKTIIRRLGVGVGSKFLIDDVTNKMTTDFTFSTSFIATEWLYSSLIVDNLVSNSDARKRNLFRTIYLGMKFVPTKEVEVYLDPFYSPSYPYGKKAGYSLGVEFGLLADFYLRIGKFVNAEVSYLDTRGDGFGYGLGWIGPRMNIDFSIHRMTSGDRGVPFTTSHSLSATIFI